MLVRDDQEVHYFNGSIYLGEPEQESISCTGCVFNKQEESGANFCDCNSSNMTQTCYAKQIVWKKYERNIPKKEEEPKFTVEQVLLAAGNYLRTAPVYEDYDKIHAEALEDITTDLLKQDDPEYKLYLELKSKYEA